ncbi:MAG: hypothetical protein AAGH15_09370 [Myxococcota bacterium]
MPRRPLVFAALCVAACAASTPEARPVSAEPMTAQDRRIFEEGIDFIIDPEALEGRWATEWREELEARVARADVVSLVRVNTLTSQTDLQQRVTFHLRLAEERALFGALPADVALSSREGSLGYPTLVGNERRILQNRFLVFLKWEQPEGATAVVPRWHLSPASEGVIRRVQRLLAIRRGDETPRGSTRVIVRENER